MIPVNLHRLKQMARRLETRQLTAEDYQVVRELIVSYKQLVDSVKDPNTTWDELCERFLSEDDGKLLSEEGGKSGAT